MYHRTAPWARRIWIAIQSRPPPPLILPTTPRCCLKRHRIGGRQSRRRLKATFRTPGDGVPESSEFGPQPNTVPDPPAILGSGWRPPSKKGKTPVPVTSVHPEAPDNLLGALHSASIDEEHRTIMSTVIQKVQSTKSGLTEACASLLTGFEVSVKI